MGNKVQVVGLVILASAAGFGLLPARGEPAAFTSAPALVARAPEAGLLAIAGPVPGRIRVLYARNGGMVLLREISVPAGAAVREVSLSADGGDLFVATDTFAYAMSTRTGRIEAQVPALRSAAYLVRASDRQRAGPGSTASRVPASRSWRNCWSRSTSAHA